MISAFSLHKRTALLLACILLFLLALLFAGCGGGGSLAPNQPASAWKQQDANYVGRARCRDCHASIDDQYAQQDMGDNAPTRMSGPRCQSCHVTGFGQPSGFNPDGSTPHLDGIGCEDCHGPGSKHVAANTSEERKANITRVPQARVACWSCHGDRVANPDGTYSPGAINQPSTPVTAQTLHDMTPKVSTPHHAPAAFLLGRDGYNIPRDMPSPHSTLPNTCLDCHKPGTSGTTNEVEHGLTALLPPNLDYTRVECASCHGGRSVNDTPVQNGIKHLLIQLGGADPTDPEEPNEAIGADGLLGQYATAHNIDLTTNAAPDDPHIIAYKGARYNFKYVMGEGSLGVHNPGFARKLLEDAISMLQQP